MFCIVIILLSVYLTPPVSSNTMLDPYETDILYTLTGGSCNWDNTEYITRRSMRPIYNGYYGTIESYIGGAQLREKCHANLQVVMGCIDNHDYILHMVRMCGGRVPQQGVAKTVVKSKTALLDA